MKKNDLIKFLDSVKKNVSKFENTENLLAYVAMMKNKQLTLDIFTWLATNDFNCNVEFIKAAKQRISKFEKEVEEAERKDEWGEGIRGFEMEFIEHVQNNNGPWAMELVNNWLKYGYNDHKVVVSYLLAKTIKILVETVDKGFYSFNPLKCRKIKGISDELSRLAEDIVTDAILNDPKKLAILKKLA